MTQANAIASGQWYLSQDGKRFGPLTSQVLRQLAGAGRVQGDAWLLQAGTDVWVRAAAVLGKLPASKPAPSHPAPSVPRPSALATASPPRGPVAAPAPSIVLTAATCPACQVRCRIPKPQGAEIHRCPHCAQQFRAVMTSVGVVARRLDACGHTSTVHDTPPRTAMP